MAGLDGGRLNIGACSLGGAQSALEKALAYMRERKAFGKRLDEFQALQFRLADMATELEAARTLLWRAAAALDAKAADATRLCAMAKRFATDTGFNVANQALQMFGGYGYLADYGVEKIVRDLRVHQILEGTNEIMRVIIAREMVGRRVCSRGRDSATARSRPGSATSATNRRQEHDHHRIHRPRQHGRADGRQSRQGGTRGRRRRSLVALREAAARAASTCRQRGGGGDGADVVVTMLPAGKHVVAVWGEIVGAAKQGALLINSSTIDVESARRAQQLAEGAGLRVGRRAGVGRRRRRQGGTLTFMCGAEAEAFAEAKPILETWASASSIAARRARARRRKFATT